MLTLFGWLLLIAPAVADEPPVADEPEVAVEEEADGTVRVEVVVPHSVADLRSVVDDPESSAALTPEILSVEVAPGEPCQEVTRRSKGLFRPLTYTAQRCRTASGWTEELLHSDDFDDYWAEWAFEPSDGETRVTYRVRSDPNLPVPRSLVRKGMRQSAAKTVENLLESLRKKD
jgi:hypothetical protein